MKYDMLKSKIAAIGENVNVTVDEEAVASVASSLVTTMLMHGSENLSSLISAEELEDCFTYAIKVILQQDSVAKPLFETVPKCLSDVMLPLNGVYRGVRINVNLSIEAERPDSYSRFLDILTSMGIPVGKVLKIDPNQTSKVMEVGIMQVQGVDMFVGLETEPSFEELVVRAMLKVSQEEQDKLSRILGHYEYMYASKDELLRQWACSLPVGMRG